MNIKVASSLVMCGVYSAIVLYCSNASASVGTIAVNNSTPKQKSLYQSTEYTTKKLSSSKTTTISFNALSTYIAEHPRSKAKEHSAESLRATAKSNAYWKDPELRIEASNFPITEPRFGVTGMTGIQVMISQSFPLTNKFAYAKEASLKQANAVVFEQEGVAREILLNIWKNLIEQEKLQEISTLYIQSLEWVDIALSVAKTIYSNNDSSSQEALLALQMQQATLRSSLVSTNSLLVSTQHALRGIMSSDIQITLSSVPWEYLNSPPHTINELPEEKAMLQNIEALTFVEKNRKAQNIPDIMAGFAYRYRNNFDKSGDYFSLVFAMPIPLISQRTAQTAIAHTSKLVAEEQLKDITAKKYAKLEEVHNSIVRITAEINIVKNDVLQYAQTAKTLAMQRYRLGSNYKEVLDAEMRILNYSINLQNLIAQKRVLQSEYIYTSGGAMIPE